MVKPKTGSRLNICHENLFYYLCLYWWLSFSFSCVCVYVFFCCCFFHLFNCPNIIRFKCWEACNMYLTSDEAWIVLTLLPSEKSKYQDDLRDDMLAEGGNSHTTGYQWLPQHLNTWSTQLRMGCTQVEKKKSDSQIYKHSPQREENLLHLVWRRVHIQRQPQNATVGFISYLIIYFLLSWSFLLW